MGKQVNNMCLRSARVYISAVGKNRCVINCVQFCGALVSQIYIDDQACIISSIYPPCDPGNDSINNSFISYCVQGVHTYYIYLAVVGFLDQTIIICTNVYQKRDNNTSPSCVLLGVYIVVLLINGKRISCSFNILLDVTLAQLTLVYVGQWFYSLFVRVVTLEYIVENWHVIRTSHCYIDI